MVNTSHLKALMKKNLIIQKRKYFSTICEILFPMILMILVVLLRKAFKINKYYYSNTTDNDYFRTNSTGISTNSHFYGFSIRNVLDLCNISRPVIGLIGENFPDKITTKINKIIQREEKLGIIILKNFATVDDINNYISSDYYGTDFKNFPQMCFGIHYDYISNKRLYNLSLHYFANNLGNGIKDIPSTLIDNLDPFQRGPDMNSYERYVNSSYFQMMKLLYDHVLQSETDNEEAEINFGVMPQIYDVYQDDTFGRFIGFILPFFLVIAYLFPLSLNVSRMVNEKETKAKEGMKIMGLSEGVYFLSYFLQYLITNTFYAIINGFISLSIFKNIGFHFLFAFFWLFGMDVFALAFFFQSVMDKTRLAMIVSILAYFIMYFVSIAILSEDVSNVPKMFLSIFPPTTLQLGVNTLAQFDSNGIKFKSSSVRKRYNNFSVGDMYLMFGIDFFIYLFLGYYLQNIIAHEFGISRPFYFLCTKKYWGFGNSKGINQQELVHIKSKKKFEFPGIEGKEGGSINGDSTPQYLTIANKSNKGIGLNEASNNNLDAEYFQNEDLYHDRNKPTDSLKIINLRKEFKDGKIAVNGISFNLYKNEIFALLGHNGAGKSTTISMLSGLYEASSGKAIYDSMNILEHANMDAFRKKLGICPQHDVLFDDLSVEEHLRMFCVFKGVSEDKRISSEIEKSLNDFRLKEQKNVIVKNLSAGQRRKLSILIALIGGSEVIFLDEPSSGMDITSRRNLWEILKQCTRDKIIVLTTHYMEEASVLGKRIGIISNGNMKCIGTPLFLIEKFGKFILVNISKEQGASDEEIVKFFKEQVKNNTLEIEVLSEEILFRIPKGKGKGDFDIKKFFTKLDSNLERLKIKSYAASMPTLEDVFLNVSSMERKNNKLVNLNISSHIENDKLLFDDNNYNIERSGFSKFTVDFSVCFKKRLYQIVRDAKSFLLEVLCPIILVIIGLAVSSVEFKSVSMPFELTPYSILQKQTIYYCQSQKEISTGFIEILKEDNITFESTAIEANGDIENSVIKFMHLLYDKGTSKENSDNYGSYYFINFDDYNKKYEFASLVNLQSRQSPIVYTEYLLNKITHYASKKKDFSITFTNYPLPKTKKEESDGQERSNSTLVFFVAVAFALIPANFVTLIIKEREKNTKHLQIISGINLISYWFSNFVFELLKYYFTGGISLIIILAFDFFPKYLWILYLLYGPSMVLFTYLFSFIFNNESSAQNFVILLNFLFGALGGSVVLILRLMEDLNTIGKALGYIFRIVPSFCFCFGFNELLSGWGLMYIEEDDLYSIKESTILNFNYIGMDCLYMGIEVAIYLLCIVYFENRQNLLCSSKEDEDENENEDEGEGERQQNEENAKVDDSQVLKEIDRTNDPSDDKSGKYAIKVKSITKMFSKGLCKAENIKALKNISFCLEYGECFGFLGINGAGKTTTFKCITNEISATKGKVLINNKDVQTHFHEVRSLIGYCPQFDAIFEYMTVYENLEFYAKIKGIVQSKMNKIITALMTEMNLIEYKNKISGKLSGGNKRKLSVTIAMICNPPIVLLDEPSTGMDPEARRFMWSIIHKISTRSKRSSVIMTTHSMDEAETLCRRIGILVNGRFKCMGSSHYIKEKYGEGYEINLQITPLSEERLEKIYDELQVKKTDEVTIDNLKRVLNKIRKKNFIEEIDKGKSGLAMKLLRELQTYGKISIGKVVSWCYYISNAMNAIKSVGEYFSKITLNEYVDNSFLFKIRRSHEANEKSIGFLFGLFEDIRKKYSIEEYSIQQTSLEQIFNKFAHEEDIKVKHLSNSDQINIEITNDLLNNLLLLKKKN